jgi:hypothetical protein
MRAMNFSSGCLLFCLNLLQVTFPARPAQLDQRRARHVLLGISGMAGFGNMRRKALFFAILAAIVSLCGPACAIVGDAGPADLVLQRHTVLVYSTKGRCTGVVLAPQLVLTAAHCVESVDGKYTVAGLARDAVRVEVSDVVRHPDHRKKPVSADIALLKLARPLPERFAAAHLHGRSLRAGDGVIVSGYGVASRGKSEQPTLRSAALVVSHLWLGRATLADAFAGERDEGRPSPCSGDSGGPVFTYRGMLALVGIMSAGDCKGTASIMTVSFYYGWIHESASKLGSPLN